MQSSSLQHALPFCCPLTQPSLPPFLGITVRFPSWTSSRRKAWMMTRTCPSCLLVLELLLRKPWSVGTGRGVWAGAWGGGCCTVSGADMEKLNTQPRGMLKLIIDKPMCVLIFSCLPNLKIQKKKQLYKIYKMSRTHFCQIHLAVMKALIKTLCTCFQHCISGQLNKQL